MSHTPGPVELLARLALQSERYRDDRDFEDAVDNVLGMPVYDAAPALLAICKDSKRILERLAAKGYLPDWDNKAIQAAIDLAKPPDVAAEKGE